MSRTDADVEGFFNDLDTDETGVLLEVVAKLDPLAMADGKPVYNGEEITLIQRFQQFCADYEVDDVEEEDVDEENSEDVAGTGETEEEYVARVQQEQNQATADALAAETEAVTDEAKPVDDVTAEEASEPRAWTPSLSDEALSEERKQNPGYGFVQ